MNCSLSQLWRWLYNWLCLTELMKLDIRKNELYCMWKSKFKNRQKDRLAPTFFYIKTTSFAYKMSCWGWVSPYSFFQYWLFHSSSNKAYLITIYRRSKGITAYLNKHCLHTSIRLLQSVKCLPSIDYFTRFKWKTIIILLYLVSGYTWRKSNAWKPLPCFPLYTASSTRGCTSNTFYLLRARKIMITITQPLISKISVSL